MSDDKREWAILDGTPQKRLFWSIISDYDTTTALCELVDNSVDSWSIGSTPSLRVAVDLDVERQLISIDDNAGGVSADELRNLITPGGSNNDPNAMSIGVFGVGSKRAAMALAESVTTKTRRGAEDSFQIDITKDWAASPSWDLPAYSIPDIAEGTTIITMSSLRHVISPSLVDQLRAHFGLVYGRFLAEERFDLSLNETLVPPVLLNQWAFPEGHAPQQVTLSVILPKEGVVKATVTGGLTYDRDPVGENYGVSFYCNKRLIAAHLKVREVGYYVATEAGVPHPDASLARVVVSLDGPAKLMPWTSSKTGINYSHPVFVKIQPTITELLSHFSSLSRRLKSEWPSEVFGRRVGKMVEVDQHESLQAPRLHLPPLPRVVKSNAEQLVARNNIAIERQPWTLGLVESIAALEVVMRQRLQTRNRVALILLDSNFEIALKEYIVHRPDFFPPSQFSDKELTELFKQRGKVIDAVLARATIPANLLDRARHYYAVRNKLIHERATVEVTDADVKNYRAVVEQTLTILFGLNLN